MKLGGMSFVNPKTLNYSPLYGFARMKWSDRLDEMRRRNS